MYHLTLRESALRARPRVNCESKAETSNCEHHSAFCLRKSLPRDSLGNLAALIESPVFRERAFCTRVVDKRTFPGSLPSREVFHTWRVCSWRTPLTQRALLSFSFSFFYCLLHPFRWTNQL